VSLHHSKAAAASVVL